MLIQLAIAAALLIGTVANAEVSKVWLLGRGNAEALELARKNISQFDCKDEHVNRCLKIFAATKLFEIEIGGEDFALVIATSQVQHWPGNNSFLVILLDSELRPVDCDLIGGEQMFATASFRKDELELMTYCEGRGGGIYTQKVQVAATGLTADEAVYHRDLDLGESVQFTLGPPTNKDAEQGDAGQSR